jgi:bifunctional ADP-heptose synthase (sugar kinase/adenylyltransferase)/phosphoglycolate phosphatase-like HAD superfamily hydrolase
VTRNDLVRLLDDIRDVRLAVLGDLCLDVYWFLDASASETSVETGLSTRPVRTQRYALGGAGNVVTNLLAMGVQRVQAFGVVGDDPFGVELVRLLSGAGADTAGVCRQAAGWSTHVYVKPYLGDAEESRLDFGNFNDLDATVADDLAGRLEAALPGLDLVIVNEQVVRGVHASTPFAQALQRLIRQHPAIPFLLDSRHACDRYDGAIRKLNDHEALRLEGAERPPEALVTLDEARRAVAALHNRWGRPVFVTRGPRGCLVGDAAGVQEVPGLQILGRTDAVGAGDSFLAGVAAALAAGRRALDAAAFGNFAAGVTVQKLFQTGTASPAEILAIGASPDYAYRPELADDPRQAHWVEGTEFERVTDGPSRRIAHAIFDHDGTISALRQGWEGVMEPMMVRAILGPRYGDAGESLYLRVVGRVREYIDRTTGIQTLVQMQGLAGMVREFGCVPAGDVLDPAGYKRIYNEALLALVRERGEKLRRGELAVADLTIKGAVPFLRALRAAGVTLYLASGTDREDVAAEARALGYDDCFEGRVYGAVGDVTQEAKRLVLERILREIGAERMADVAAFGDGPVEIRETHRFGGLAVGVASDEVRRYGLNPSKRSRLIRAGADLIIPDFSQAGALLALLGLASPAAGRVTRRRQPRRAARPRGS